MVLRQPLSSLPLQPLLLCTFSNISPLSHSQPPLLRCFLFTLRVVVYQVIFEKPNVLSPIESSAWSRRTGNVYRTSILKRFVDSTRELTRFFGVVPCVSRWDNGMTVSSNFLCIDVCPKLGSLPLLKEPTELSDLYFKGSSVFYLHRVTKITKNNVNIFITYEKHF